MQVVMCRLIITGASNWIRSLLLHICPAQKTFQMQAGTTGGQARQGKKRVKQLPYLNECDKIQMVWLKKGSAREKRKRKERTSGRQKPVAKTSPVEINRNSGILAEG